MSGISIFGMWQVTQSLVATGHAMPGSSFVGLERNVSHQIRIERKERCLEARLETQWPLCLIESLTLPLDCSITILEGKGKWE